MDRFSLAVKVNLVIMALVLSISALLTLISERAYQETVFRPYFRKLENTEIPAEKMTPVVQELRSYIGTEELNRVISENDKDENKTYNNPAAYEGGRGRLCAGHGAV